MNQSLTQSVIQGVLDLVIGSRVGSTENMYVLLPKIAETLPIEFTRSGRVTAWFFQLMGVSDHYSCLHRPLEQKQQLTLTFKVEGNGDRRILCTERWNISVRNAGGCGSEGEQEARLGVVQLVRDVFRILQNLPLTSCLGSNRNLQEQCSIYYIISRSEYYNRPQQNFIQLEDYILGSVIEVSVECDGGEDLMAQTLLRQQRGDIKRKESCSTMKSENQLEQIDQYEGGMLHFEEDEDGMSQGNSSNNSFLNIFLEEEREVEQEQESEVIQCQESLRLLAFRQNLEALGGTIGISMIQ